VCVCEAERYRSSDARSASCDEHHSAREHFASIAVAAGMVTMVTKRALGSAKAAALPTAGAEPELATAPMEGSTRCSTNVSA
jgi:hypothetical protein